jgi:exopolysaccharide biosynthesis polyprenyl glycosylphosphotransferase
MIPPTSSDFDEGQIRHKFEYLVTATEIIGDFVAATIGVMGAYGGYHVLGLGKDLPYSAPTVVVGALAFALMFVTMLDREGVYHSGSGILSISETERTLRVSVQAFLVLFVLMTVGAHLLSRWILGIAFLLVPMMVLIEKYALFSLVRYLHSRGLGVRKAILYGAGFTGRRVYSALLRSRKLGINPVVFVDDDKENVGKTIYALGYHHEQCMSVIAGPLTSQLIKDYDADIIVIATPSLRQEKMSEIAVAAKEAKAVLSFVPREMDHEDQWIDYIDIDGIMLSIVDAPKGTFFYTGVKRIVDILLSVTALMLLLPLLTVVALAVRFDSEGPIIFKQQRVGKNGRFFEMYKFRTMRISALKYEASPVSSEDSRITRIGRILRKTSLDELPQIVNVIKGEMSFVGPRPEMPFIVQSYGQRERWRLSVMPGITGLWQLSADRAYPIHESLQYDFYYIRNRGFFMDLAILLHTVIFAVKGV